MACYLAWLVNTQPRWFNAGLVYTQPRWFNAGLVQIVISLAVVYVLILTGVIAP
ncbi:MAG: hypothetical protein IH903_01800 [Proteobacteria bacterium]|nr:hypothetical protein [Pseudomonadota bacterium]